MTLDECFEERKLRWVRPDALKAKKSLSTAREMLSEAEGLEKAGFYRMSVVTAYAAMFHAGRALLFRDGVVEKSHYCLALYLRKNYGESGKLPVGLITALDGLREERHDVLYGFSGAKLENEDAESAIESAGRFIEAVARLLKE